MFVLAAEQFGVPAVLGTPSRIRVLTTSIVSTQAFYPPQRGLGAALSVTLLAIALFGLFLQRMVLRGRSSTTVAGKSSHPRRVRLGPFRWVLFAICTTVPSARGRIAVRHHLRELDPDDLDLVFQLGAVHSRALPLALLEYPLTQRAIVNSLFLAVVGATVTIVFCALISFLSLRTKLPGRNALDYLSMLPLGILVARLRDARGLDQSAARALRHDMDPVHRLHDAVFCRSACVRPRRPGPDPPRARGSSFCGAPAVRLSAIVTLPEARDHRRLDPAVPRVYARAQRFGPSLFPGLKFSRW